MLTLTKQANSSGSYNWENFFFNVYRSDDSGGSWAAMDSAHSPRYGWVGHFNQAANKITVLCRQTYDSAAAWQLYDFNLTTDMWGTAYAAGLNSDPVRITYPCRTLTRANGHTCLIFDGYVQPAYTTFALQLVEWDGAIWSPPLRIDSAGAQGDIFRAAVMEPVSGKIHLVFVNTNISPRTILHRVIRTDNTLGPLSTLWTEGGGNTSDRDDPMPLAFFGGKVYKFRYDRTPSGANEAGYLASVGTPDSEPTSFTTVSVSGPIPPPQSYSGCALVTSGGSALHYLYAYNNVARPGSGKTSGQYRRATTTDGTSWSNSLFFDLWPTTYPDYAISAAWIGTGGVDGIGAFAQLPGDPSNTYYMVKNAGGGAAAVLENYAL